MSETSIPSLTAALQDSLPEDTRPKEESVPDSEGADIGGFFVLPEEINEEAGFNLRNIETPAAREHIENLKQAFLAGDYIHPVIVREDEYGRLFLVDGHCRRKAALAAQKESGRPIKLAAVKFAGTPTERITLMLRSSEGLKLSAVEIAKGYRRLHMQGWEYRDIAKKVGRKPGYVEDMVILACTDIRIQKWVEEGKVSVGAAVKAAKQYGDDACKHLQALLDKAHNAGLSRVTEGTSQRWLPPRPVVAKVLDALQTVRSALREQDRVLLDEYRRSSEKEQDTRTIEVPLSVLDSLMAAQEAVSEKEQEKVERDKRRREKQSGWSDEQDGAHDSDKR